MDPRKENDKVEARRANLSPLMKAKLGAKGKDVVNFCPFGCAVDEGLDEHGYCDHLIGITIPGSNFEYEPMIHDQFGRRIIKVAREKTKRGGEGAPIYEKVQKGDKLVRITDCSRVYRKLTEPLPERKLTQLTKMKGKKQQEPATAGAA